MQVYRERHSIPGVGAGGRAAARLDWPGPITARLVRAAARIATRVHGAWIVAYVETPAELGLPPADHARVVENLRLAESLGAETITLSGQNVTEELLLLAKERNVTKIVLGKPARAAVEGVAPGLGGQRVGAAFRRRGSTSSAGSAPT